VESRPARAPHPTASHERFLIKASFKARPTGQILAAEVLNYSSLARPDGLILHTEVGIGYETPWRQVEAMLLAAAERTEGVSGQPVHPAEATG
jgi:hypothetical protein